MDKDLNVNSPTDGTTRPWTARWPVTGVALEAWLSELGSSKSGRDWFEEFRAIGLDALHETAPVVAYLDGVLSADAVARLLDVWQTPPGLWFGIVADLVDGLLAGERRNGQADDGSFKTRFEKLHGREVAGDNGGGDEDTLYEDTRRAWEHAVRTLVIALAEEARRAGVPGTVLTP